MNRALSLVGVTFSLVSLVSCSRNLPEREAAELTRKSEGYPRLASVTFSRVKADSPLGREIARLVQEGYFVPGDAAFRPAQVAEKGADIVEDWSWNKIWEQWRCSFFAYRADIQVKRILTDSRKGEAEVEYEEVYKLTPYGERLLSLGAELPRERRSEEMTARFRKYDQGWTLAHD